MPQESSITYQPTPYIIVLDNIFPFIKYFVNKYLDFLAEERLPWIISRRTNSKFDKRGEVNLEDGTRTIVRQMVKFPLAAAASSSFLGSRSIALAFRNFDH